MTLPSIHSWTRFQAERAFHLSAANAKQTIPPYDEVLRAFDDLVRAGKVLYVGMSDTPAWVVAQAVTTAALRGWTAPVAVQAPWSLADRGVERDLLPMARAFGLAVTPWGLLEGGVLTGKYEDPDSGPRRYGDEQQSERVLSLAHVVRDVAQETGRTVKAGRKGERWPVEKVSTWGWMLAGSGSSFHGSWRVRRGPLLRTRLA